MMKHFLALISLIGAASAAAAGDWGYKYNGVDWPFIKDIKDNACANSMQSPIDLPWNMDESKIIPFKNDQFNQIYTNPKDVEVIWNDKTSIVYLPTGDVNLFQSWHNYDTRKTCHLWKAAQFHWHHQSEHTIDG